MKHILAMYPKQEELDDFLFLQNNNKILVIAFGGIKQGLGMHIPPFEFMRSLHDKDCDVMFLRDREQAYYHLGVNGIAGNIDGVTSFLKKIIDAGKYDLVVTLGNSMGGYAALLFGSKIGADVCIGISPRTFLDQNNRGRYNDDRRNAEIERLYELCENKESRSYYDLHSYFLSVEKASEGRSPLCLVFYGDKDRLDKIHSRRMVGLKSFHIFGIKNAAHDTAQKMRDSGLLDQLISELLRFAGNKDKETLLHLISKYSPEIMIPSLPYHTSE
jgi:hypothetical protein